LQHDFLWRATRDLPERGRIGIFNRSYYEKVLIAPAPAAGTPSSMPASRRTSMPVPSCGAGAW
jgi:polyphosphate kinase 2 (PPK2 family)